jgi:hypothetical protein
MGRLLVSSWLEEVCNSVMGMEAEGVKSIGADRNRRATPNQAAIQISWDADIWDCDARDHIGCVCDAGT